jgi:hypothetical protein
MVYTTDDAQLLGLWTAIRFIGEVRKIKDPNSHDEILMRTQLLLTAFAVGLEPRICDQRGRSRCHPLAMNGKPRTSLSVRQ